MFKSVQGGGPKCGERRLPWWPVCVKIESALSDIGQPINAWTRRQCGAPIAKGRGAVEKLEMAVSSSAAAPQNEGNQSGIWSGFERFPACIALRDRADPAHNHCRWQTPALHLSATQPVADLAHRAHSAPMAPALESIMREYAITDRGEGGIEFLVQACATVDRVEALRDAIDRDGAVVPSRTGPKAHPALRDELAGRAFVVRTLERLGLNIEIIKSDRDGRRSRSAGCPRHEPHQADPHRPTAHPAALTAGDRAIRAAEAGPPSTSGCNLHRRRQPGRLLQQRVRGLPDLVRPPQPAARGAWTEALGVAVPAAQSVSTRHRCVTKLASG